MDGYVELWYWQIIWDKPWTTRNEDGSINPLIPIGGEWRKCSEPTAYRGEWSTLEGPYNFMRKFGVCTCRVKKLG